MKFLRYIKEAEEETDQKTKDIERIVQMVKAATDKNQLNNAVKTAAPLYKIYGDEWLSDLKKALSVDIVPETVKQFIEITKNFSEKLTHLKEN